jgi:hypothetical protein
MTRHSYASLQSDCRVAATTDDDLQIGIFRSPAIREDQGEAQAVAMI